MCLLTNRREHSASRAAPHGRSFAAPTKTRGSRRRSSIGCWISRSCRRWYVVKSLNTSRKNLRECTDTTRRKRADLLRRSRRRHLCNSQDALGHGEARRRLDLEPTGGNRNGGRQPQRVEPF